MVCKRYEIRDIELIVIFDEFEAIGRRLNLFQDWGEDWRPKASANLLTMLIASKRPLSELYQSLSLTSPFGNIFSTTILGALEEDDWCALLKNSFGTISDSELALIDELAGGMPYYVQMAGSLLWQHSSLKRTREEFSFQARPRFQELWDDLTGLERNALRSAAGISGLAVPMLGMVDMLGRHGLLRPNGKLFSSAFADFARGQS